MGKDRPLRVFFSAGEPSGDLHGANLIRQLQSDHSHIEAVGYGGPEMAAAGCRLHTDLTALAVMWILRVLVNLHKFWGLVSRADRYFRHHKPDAVVLIDYPGFNWWIAWRAKVHGIPVFYYAPPQVWAWARWRVKKMRRLVDHVLCALPFEARWFAEHGCNATFVGHPFFDEVQGQTLDAAFIEQHRRQQGPLVVILPGSRSQEVANNLHWFLKAAETVRQRVPGARLAVAAFKPRHAEIARNQAAQRDLPVEVHTGRTPELIRLADCCMACSGSVSLELLYHAKPTVILYWIGRFGFFVQRFFRKVKYITLVNLLSVDDPFVDDVTTTGTDQALFPEYLTSEDKSAEVAAHVVRWLTDSSAHDTRVAELKQLREEVAHGGAASQAAQYILNVLQQRPAPIPQPHYLDPNRRFSDDRLPQRSA